MWTDSYPVSVSSKHVERKERRDLLNSDIPEWLQEFIENLVDDRVPEQRLTCDFFSWIIFRAYEKCGVGSAQCLYSFPSRPKFWDLSEDQNYKGSVQKTQWRSRTSCWKFWWLDNSRSQISLWRMWISKQSSICCCRGAGLGYPMDPGVSVQNKNFTGNPEKLAKVLGADRKPEVIYTDNSLEFGKACEVLSRHPGDPSDFTKKISVTFSSIWSLPYQGGCSQFLISSKGFDSSMFDRKINSPLLGNITSSASSLLWRFPMCPPSPTPQGLQPVRHPSKFSPRTELIQGTIHVRLSFQNDVFLTGHSEKTVNAQPMNQTEWLVFWMVFQKVFRIEFVHQTRDLECFADRCHIP